LDPKGEKAKVAIDPQPTTPQPNDPKFDTLKAEDFYQKADKVWTFLNTVHSVFVPSK
jgi:hypothetical protein